ncbi:MAG: response regulator [Deltaproteobacteria bacterium]|nr:response regulator [Deltaproteobacteria bacterium]
MARILVVEDEADLQEVLAYSLRQRGDEPVQAFRGADALRLAREKRPDLVLLDVMLPDLPGTEVCKALKRDPATAGIPIVMLTAKGEEIDRVLGFELGAEDYVVKPFSVRELMLRIGVVLKRGKAVPTTESVVQFGPLRVDREAHRVFVEDVEVHLTPMEFELLVTLHGTRDRVQTRSVLLDKVWGIEADITTRTVDTHVKRLREKLGRAGDYIETVRGVGYRFAATPGGERA